MNTPNVVLLIYSFCIHYIEVRECATINDTNVLMEDLLTGYNTMVRPITDQDKPVIINVSLILISIQELDEVHGIFSIVAALNLTWIDDKMVWDPSSYGGIKSISAKYEDIWVPQLILVSPGEEIDALGKKWQSVYFESNGFALWTPGDLIKSTCSVDMKYYPFDTQICGVYFAVWGYSETQVTLQTPDSHVDLASYDGNSIWTLKNALTEFHGRSVAFLFYLERKSGFIIVNVVLPLTFLSLLNAFVFLLVPESGERMSYCITILLSIAVFMTIVSDTLPRSSEPVPSISYKLLFDLINSALITLITIFNIRLYNKTDTTKVPRLLQKLYLILACKHQNGKIMPADSKDEQFCEKKDQLADKRNKEAKPENNQLPEKITIDETSTDVKYLGNRSVLWWTVLRSLPSHFYQSSVLRYSWSLYNNSFYFFSK